MGALWGEKPLVPKRRGNPFLLRPPYFATIDFREVDQVKLIELGKILLYIEKACNQYSLSERTRMGPSKT